MPSIQFGKKGEPAVELVESTDLIAVRTRSRRPVRRTRGPVASAEPSPLSDGQVVASFPESGVEVFRVPVGVGVRAMGERKETLRRAPDIQFAGGVLLDPTSRTPVLYTENLFIKFVDTADADDCAAVLRREHLTVKSKVPFAINGFFAEALPQTGQEVFEIAQRLLKRDDVEYAHPEVIRTPRQRAINAQQWHLKRTTIGGIDINAHANVEAAHELSLGDGVTIAVIDGGMDIDHPEFSGPNKIVAPRDMVDETDDPRPKDGVAGHLENHGTACAGVACANGDREASGVAPRARLMPIRQAAELGSQREANAFVWAADQGADVISCSWGPEDGNWDDPEDPRHRHSLMMPPSTRLAIDYAIKHGRGGKGCVICFAAGNGNESVDHDGYASHPNVVAVAACNDSGTRSVYSDFGQSIWCTFPSSDFPSDELNHRGPSTDGIWTTDRTGPAGYDPGSDYTGTFGGTSSACPGVAGVVALMLSVNPSLKWHEVRELLRQACDRIDPANGNYSAGHSPYYGYGRVNALRAVQLAQPTPRRLTTTKRTFNAAIVDNSQTTLTLDVAESTPVAAVQIELDITHENPSDLIVTVIPPSSTGVGPITLINRDNELPRLTKMFDNVAAPDLSHLVGKCCQGTWTIEILDMVPQDVGTLISVAIELSLP